MGVRNQPRHVKRGRPLDFRDLRGDLVDRVRPRPVHIHDVEHPVLLAVVPAELVQDHRAGRISAGVHDNAAAFVLHRGQDRRVKGLELRPVSPLVGVRVDADTHPGELLRQLAAAEVGIFHIEIAERERVGQGSFCLHFRERCRQRDRKLRLSASEMPCHDDDPRSFRHFL